MSTEVGELGDKNSFHRQLVLLTQCINNTAHVIVCCVNALGMQNQLATRKFAIIAIVLGGVLGPNAHFQVVEIASKMRKVNTRVC